MNKMISVASGFQYSVNIGYDLNNEEKIKNFIPTASALGLLEDILLSTLPSSTDRARVLIGAYGKGKSHIMLMILSLLMKKDLSLFEKTLEKIEGTKLHQSIINYYESEERILPIIVTGSNTSLTQAFLLALQRTLSSNDFLDIMPETNYEAALISIRRWEKEFPETYQKFSELISVPAEVFVDRLKSFDTHAYEEFERIYPALTAGSVFNPFLGFDVVELYENAAKGLRKKGFTGVFVVYDEFSKYLEANIAAASVSDTKMLQDFAEKCNRSGSLQMHIMLISHKEKANDIDVLPKQKVDGWRGVSERFLHVRLSNNFSQTYEIIESVIHKEKELWDAFCLSNDKQFATLEERYLSHPVFSGMTEDEVKKTVVGCYPLHPIATFILPRLSERVAQNERTLFTFLSSNGQSTLPSYLEAYDDHAFSLITPDRIYDYFEPLFKKEVYSGSLHENYILTEIILEELDGDSLESKIVKSISLIYILEQFEKLRPTKEELFGIFSGEYTHEEIDAAINSLIEKEYVVYLKRSNNYLQLKQSSGVDIQQKISDVVEAQRSTVSVEEALNSVNYENYLYPSRYNDAHEMIRYFVFRFIGEDSLDQKEALDSIVNNDVSDGIIFGLLPKSADSIQNLREKAEAASRDYRRAIFVLPKSYLEIEQYVREFKAVLELRDNAAGDKVLFDEYEVVYEDLRDLIVSYIASYSRPERFQSVYVYAGEVQPIKRKAALSELLSRICDEVYAKTPVINNEALNRNEATSMARNSRNKVVTALLRSELEPNLGLTGTGQEVSIMRSTLVRTGVIENAAGDIRINLNPRQIPMIANMLGEIKTFIGMAREKGCQSFTSLYETLCSPKDGIALRRELVPIYLAAVLHEFKQQIIIKDRFGQVALTAETIMQINALPENYQLEYIDWNPDKVEFIQRMESVFCDAIVGAEKNASPYDYIISAMKRWYVSLPKYVKEMKTAPDGKRIDKGYAGFIRLLRQYPSGHEFLFQAIPQAFGYSDFVVGVADNISGAKRYYDDALNSLRHYLSYRVKLLFLPKEKHEHINQMSLTSVIRDWCESLDPKVFEQLFSDGTERCLALLKAISNDEDTFIARLAKVTTDLRIEDWNDQTLEICITNLQRHKKTAEAFRGEVSISCSDQPIEGNTYQITFASSDGILETRRFERVLTSNRGKLLLNKLTADLDSFGQAVTEAEKRQILMEVLKKLC